MSEPVIASLGASPLSPTDLPGRDLFSVAFAAAFDELPDPADLVEAVCVGNQSQSYEHRITGTKHCPPSLYHTSRKQLVTNIYAEKFYPTEQ